MARRYAYERITGAQLGAALVQLNLSLRQFAWLGGYAPDRVARWLNDTEEIPHNAALVCAMATIPDALALGMRFTNSRAKDKRHPNQ